MTSEPDAAGPVFTSGEIVVSLLPEGILVGGDPDAVATYLERISATTRNAAAIVSLNKATLGNTTGLLAGVTSVLGQSGKFVQLHPDSIEAITRGTLIPSGSSDYFRMVTKGADGKFLQQLQWKPSNVNPTRFLSAHMVAVHVALMTAVAEVEEAVARVEGKVEEVLRLAHANRAGDVLGDNISIGRAVTYLEKHGSIPDADWDSMAAIGPALSRTVEQLRQHADRILKSFDTEVSIRERAELVTRAVTDDHLGETLSLLVVAQDSLYKWQRLRLARVEKTQPEHVQKVVDDARELIAGQLLDDGRLYQRARNVLESVASTKTSDGFFFWSVSDLRRDLPVLQGDLDAFARARRAHVGTWKEFDAPDFLAAASDALDTASVALGTAAGAAGRALTAAGTGVTQVSNFLTRFGSKQRRAPNDDDQRGDGGN